MKIGRNDRCPCGSGKKYKKCCLNKDTLAGEDVRENVKPFIVKSNQDLFVIHESLLTIADKILDETVNANELRVGIGAFFIGKAYKTVRAILILCREGYGEDGANLVRGLFDLMINYLYMINIKSDDRLERYIQYDWFERASMYKNYGAQVPEIEEAIKSKSINPKPFNNSLDEILEQADNVTKKYGYSHRSGWAGISRFEMAQSIGREDAYKSIYKLQSQLSHTSPRAINEYMKREDSDGYVVNVGPSDNWVQNNLVATFDFFSHLLTQYDKLIGSTRNQELHQLQVKYLKVMKTSYSPR